MTRPAVFLDRGGTLVEEVPYVHDPERLVLLPGVGELAALAAAALHRRLRRLLAGAGVRLDAVLYCPHHPEGPVTAYARTCRDRKPGPGMLEAAARRLGLDLAASFLIGNAPADAGAAVAAGATPLFVTTGQAAGRPPPPGGRLRGLAAAVDAVLAGAVPAGREEARPAPAVTERAWPGMPVGRERARP